MDNKSIFEKIISKELNSFEIYRDKNFVAILDIAPKKVGHTLLIPINKSENIFEASDDIKKNILLVAKKISNKIKKQLNATGIKLVLNNGASAGQVVFHTHLHIIPYYDNEIKIEKDDFVTIQNLLK